MRSSTDCGSSPPNTFGCTPVGKIKLEENGYYLKFKFNAIFFLMDVLTNVNDQISMSTFKI